MTKTTKAKQVAKTVLVRTYSAGVHVGTLGARSGDEVELTNARRIWRWKGGNTLHEIALHGPGRGSQVSETVPEIILNGWIEIIPCTPEAIENVAKAGWGT